MGAAAPKGGVERKLCVQSCVGCWFWVYSVPAGRVSREQIREIAQMKLHELNAYDLDKAVKMIEGTARSMGIEIV